MVNAIIALATVVTVLAVVEIWANRLVLNPENWSNTSTQLLQNDTVRAATSAYLVDQLYANVNVQGIVEGALPGQFKRIAGPVSGALRGAAVSGVSLLLTRPRVQSLWRAANRAADESLVNVIDGRRGAVNVAKGAVVLNLAAVINQVAARLGLPKNVASHLPPSVGEITVVKSDQLALVQTLGNALQGLAILLGILAPGLYVLAIALAGGFRRRALMTAGWAIVFAGVIVFLARTLLVQHLADAIVTDASLRPAATAVLGIATALLAEIAGATVLVGLLLALAAWVAGPSREAVATRRFLAPTLRDHPPRAYAVVIVLLALIFIWQPIPATGNWWGILIFTVLALLGTEVLRRQTIAEFPRATVAGAGGGTAALGRWRTGGSSGGTGARASGSSTTESVADQLERLAALRASGAVTDEEYGAAKAKLLGSSQSAPVQPAGPAEPAEPAAEPATPAGTND
jgi:hypothetical protein